MPFSRDETEETTLTREHSSFFFWRVGLSSFKVERAKKQLKVAFFFKAFFNPKLWMEPIAVVHSFPTDIVRE